ncbi:hypothetical protein E2542_SST00892 [Spatholobus suberectus]|nr:hypothetical protein E2542_SST00892 [Spatholobus suberectus]
MLTVSSSIVKFHFTFTRTLHQSKFRQNEPQTQIQMKLQTLYIQRKWHLCAPHLKHKSNGLIRGTSNQQTPLFFFATYQSNLRRRRNPIPPPHMAKGRKLTTSRSERFLGTYAYSQGSAAVDPSELREEDVWSTGGDAGEHEWEPHAAGGSSVRGRRRIPRDTEEQRRVGGLSLAFEEPGERRVAEDRAPVPRSRGGGVDAARTPRGDIGAGERAGLEQDTPSRLGRVAERRGRGRVGDGAAARVSGA